LERLEDLPPIGSRHHNVERDGLGLQPPRERQHERWVLHADDLEIGLAQVAPEHPHCRGLVIHDKHNRTVGASQGQDQSPQAGSFGGRSGLLESGLDALRAAAHRGQCCPVLLVDARADEQGICLELDPQGHFAGAHVAAQRHAPRDAHIQCVAEQAQQDLP